MDPERFARLGEIFAHARDLPEDRRAAYVREACGDDAELRTEVEELLAEDAEHRGDRYGGGDKREEENNDQERHGALSLWRETELTDASPA